VLAIQEQAFNRYTNFTYCPWGYSLASDGDPAFKIQERALSQAEKQAQQQSGVQPVSAQKALDRWTNLEWR